MYVYIFKYLTARQTKQINEWEKIESIEFDPLAEEGTKEYWLSFVFVPASTSYFISHKNNQICVAPTEILLSFRFVSFRLDVFDCCSFFSSHFVTADEEAEEEERLNKIYNNFFCVYSERSDFRGINISFKSHWVSGNAQNRFVAIRMHCIATLCTDKYSDRNSLKSQKSSMHVYVYAAQHQPHALPLHKTTNERNENRVKNEVRTKIGNSYYEHLKRMQSECEQDESSSERE